VPELLVAHAAQAKFLAPDIAFNEAMNRASAMWADITDITPASMRPR
jgi:hypothetical protein